MSRGLTSGLCRFSDVMFYGPHLKSFSILPCRATAASASQNLRAIIFTKLDEAIRKLSRVLTNSQT